MPLPNRTTPLRSEQRDGARSGRSTLAVVTSKIGRAAASSWAFTLACAIFIALQLVGASAVNTLDSAVSAFRMRTIESAPSGDVVVVTIDAQSLRADNTWPWPREKYARVINNLQVAGAGLIAFDVDFSAVSNPHGDAALKAAVDANPGSVVFATFAQPEARTGNKPAETVGDTAILGSANVEIAPDGKVRRYRNGYVLDGAYRPTLAGVLANAPYGDTSGFKLDYGVRTEEIPSLSFETVHAGAFDPALIAGRNILIGATALELGDRFATPVDPALPGVLVHAVAFENMRSGRMLMELSRPATIGLGLIALALLWPRPDRIDVRRLFAHHVAIAVVLLALPFIVQALVPLSLNLSTILIAQAFCVWAAIRRELNRRNAEIVRQREDHLTHIAMHDPETGLPNRRAMLDRINALLSAGDTDGLRVMAVGVDAFGTLRAAIGFDKANDAVVSFCRQLEDSYRGSTCFRLSASLIGVVSDAELSSRAQTWMARGFADTHMMACVDDLAVQLTIRTGSACAADGVTAEELVERATSALDAARREDARHRNFEELANIDPRIRLAMVSGVEKAIAQGEFALMYQAKVAAASAEVTGAEALIRWEHPVFGRLSPADFIPVAEKTGAIDALTMWVLDRAIADQAEARSAGIYLPISVNMSARTLSNVGFRDLAIRKVEKAGADICFEITETAVIESDSVAAEAIAAYRAAGIRVSIDDFGAGLSSLAYLMTLDADELKLDKSLIDNIAVRERDREIVGSTVRLAHKLGMRVVAEGVETEEMYLTLAELGCDYLQGYFFARPVTAADFVRDVAARFAAHDVELVTSSDRPMLRRAG